MCDNHYANQSDINLYSQPLDVEELKWIGNSNWNLDQHIIPFVKNACSSIVIDDDIFMWYFSLILYLELVAPFSLCMSTFDNEWPSIVDIQWNVFQNFLKEEWLLFFNQSAKIKMPLFLYAVLLLSVILVAKCRLLI